MLSKQDIQNIREVIREEATNIVRQEIRESVPTIVKEELKPIKRKLNRIEKDVRYIAKDFDVRIATNSRAIQKLQDN